MIATDSSSTAAIPEVRRAGASLLGLRLRAVEVSGLTAVLLLAAGLNLWRLDQNGYGNTYYAVAVQSMLKSWHNFFFASYDAGGFITVDKPPVGLWVQAASAAIFGFNGYALLLPEVMAGVAAVAIVYYLIRRLFGPLAAFAGALVMSVTPIGVAVERSNNLDAILMFTLVLAAWAMLRAVETGKFWRLMLAVALVGVAFNVKMLEAFAVLPTFYLVYLLAARTGMSEPSGERGRRRVSYLAVATAALVVVAFSWTMVVELTPAANRPWVGGSKINSELDLVINYNGLGRVTGQGEGFGGGFDGRGFPSGGNQSNNDNFFGSRTVISGGPFDSGTPGALRLFGDDLAGQWSWLFPVTLVGLVAAVWTNRKRLSGPRGQFLLLWSGWFATYALVFSFAQGIFHSYYLVMLAPAVGALAGPGLAALWSTYLRGKWLALLLPFSVLATAVWQAHVLGPYLSWANVLVPVLVAGSIVAILLLLIPMLPSIAGHAVQVRRIASGALVVGSLSLIVSPIAWSVTPALAAGNSNLPAAGPPGSGLRGGPAGFGGPGGFGGRGQPGQPGQPGQQANGGLISYLQANRDGYFYLVAVSSANEASPIALQTGQPVLAMGGFMGSDPAMTVEKLQAMVASKQVRFIMGGGGGFGPRGGDSSVSQWVQSNCTPVDASQYGGQSRGGFRAGFGGSQLYSCSAGGQS